MRPELRIADERWEVVRAAEAWRGAGAIDDAQRARIVERHRDDRHRTKPAFRALFFCFTLMTCQAAWGSAVLVIGGAGDLQPSFHAALLLVMAGLAAFGAAAAIEAHRLRRFGVEEGLVASALAFVAAAAFLLADEAGLASRGTLVAVALAVTAGAAAAAWRWGVPATGALAAVGLFAALYAAPGARWLWLGAGIALAAASARRGDDPATAPAHRRRLVEAEVVGWLAAYAAVHPEGVRSGLFLGFGRGSGLAAAPALVAGAWAAAFLLPAVLVALGLRRRDRLQLALGALLLAVSSAGAADALDLEPVWLVLVASGGALLLLAGALRRLFAGAPQRVRGGFTDGPLYEGDRRSAAEIAAAVAVFTPEGRREPGSDGFEGGGGELGGGGASSKY